MKATAPSLPFPPFPLFPYLFLPAPQATISNDGAKILHLLDIVHPAAKTLVDIARAQDAEIGDGTTTVTLIAAELLRQAKPYVEDGVHPQIIVRVRFVGKGRRAKRGRKRGARREAVPNADGNEREAEKEERAPSLRPPSPPPPSPSLNPHLSRRASAARPSSRSSA